MAAPPQSRRWLAAVRLRAAREVVESLDRCSVASEGPVGRLEQWTVLLDTAEVVGRPRQRRADAPGATGRSRDLRVVGIERRRCAIVRRRWLHAIDAGRAVAGTAQIGGLDPRKIGFKRELREWHRKAGARLRTAEQDRGWMVGAPVGPVVLVGR